MNSYHISSNINFNFNTYISQKLLHKVGFNLCMKGIFSNDIPQRWRSGLAGVLTHLAELSKGISCYQYIMLLFCVQCQWSRTYGLPAKCDS